MIKLGLFYPKKSSDFNKAAASHWIRVLQMEKYYREAGFDVSINKPFKRYDVAIFFRKPKQKYFRFMQFLKLTSKMVFFDTCINIFDEHVEIDKKRLKIAYKIGRLCDGVICASDNIAEQAKPYSKAVFVMDDPIDFRDFGEVKQEVNLENPQFGWSGVPHKAVYLNKYGRLLNGKTTLITKEYIKDQGLNFKYNFVPWFYETFPKELHKCDVGFLPRRIDEAYNAGHSSHKALVFASMGIPVIANKIPSYEKLAKYFNGIVFLEDHEDDLKKCLRELKRRDRDISRLKAYYSCENQANRLKAFLSN